MNWVCLDENEFGFLLHLFDPERSQPSTNKQTHTSIATTLAPASNIEQMHKDLQEFLLRAFSELPALPTSIHSMSHSTVPPPSYAWAIKIDPPEYDAYKDDLPVELQDSDYLTKGRCSDTGPLISVLGMKSSMTINGHSILERRAANDRCCHHGAINRLIARNAGRVYDEGPRGLFSLWAEERATVIRHHVFDGPELSGFSSDPDEEPRNKI
ncbi:hypothetical protein LTR27_008954 [Elasticomyces elasticus]|nr:hypothetical protein LTR27_008954 [Elasticomyces elasticus]